MPAPKTISVLLVEDDPGDVLLIQEALRESGLQTLVAHVADGVQALDYLHQSGDHAEAPRPDLVLLDINLPRKSGLEVLAELKADAGLATIPVVMLTTSSADDDVRAAYQDRANAFITKPVEYDRFLEVVSSIDTFFAETAHLPSGRPPSTSTSG